MDPREGVFPSYTNGVKKGGRESPEEIPRQICRGRWGVKKLVERKENYRN